MDRMLYVAMSAARQALTAQAVTANNLANVSTPGFKADLTAFRAALVTGDGLPSRVYTQLDDPAVDFTPGTLERTGNTFDVAVAGEGFLAVQARDGSEAYTRSGALRLNGNGLLETADGLLVLGNGGPVSIPPAASVEIAADGTISIQPVGQAPNTLAQVDRLKLVRPPIEQLVKGPDGLFRLADGSTAPADASVTVRQGMLEASNVNAVDALVHMIDTQRRFELAVKAMRTVEQDDAAAAQILSLAG